MVYAVQTGLLCLKPDAPNRLWLPVGGFSAYSQATAGLTPPNKNSVDMGILTPCISCHSALHSVTFQGQQSCATILCSAPGRKAGTWLGTELPCPGCSALLPSWADEVRGRRGGSPLLITSRGPVFSLVKALLSHFHAAWVMSVFKTSLLSLQ